MAARVIKLGYGLKGRRGFQSLLSVSKWGWGTATVLRKLGDHNLGAFAQQ